MEKKDFDIYGAGESYGFRCDYYSSYVLKASSKNSNENDKRLSKKRTKTFLGTFTSLLLLPKKAHSATSTILAPVNNIKIIVTIFFLKLKREVPTEVSTKKISLIKRLYLSRKPNPDLHKVVLPRTRMTYMDINDLIKATKKPEILYRPVSSWAGHESTILWNRTKKRRFGGSLLRISRLSNAPIIKVLTLTALITLFLVEFRPEINTELEKIKERLVTKPSQDERDVSRKYLTKREKLKEIIKELLRLGKSYQWILVFILQLLLFWGLSRYLVSRQAKVILSEIKNLVSSLIGSINRIDVLDGQFQKLDKYIKELVDLVNSNYTYLNKATATINKNIDKNLDIDLNIDKQMVTLLSKQEIIMYRFALLKKEQDITKEFFLKRISELFAVVFPNEGETLPKV